MKESRYGLGPKVQSCSGRRDKSFRPKNGSFGHSGAKLVFLALKFKVDKTKKFSRGPRGFHAKFQVPTINAQKVPLK